MSRHDVRVTLAQVRDHAEDAVAMAAGRTRADLDHDRMLELSLARLVEIVGEAATRVPPLVVQLGGILGDRPRPRGVPGS